jgi:hypothetical protein
MNELLIGRSSFTERTNMSSLPSELLLNSQLAKRRLEEVFNTTRDPGCDNQSSPITGTALVTIDQNEPTRRQRPTQGLTPSRDIFRDSTRNKRQRSDRTEGDMTAACFTLTLLLIGTIAAAHTDRPVFWLLMGPVPLAAAFATIACFQQKPSRRSSFLFAGGRDSSRR